MSLAQVFTVNEPAGGATHVAISAVYLYFKAISNSSPIDIQIREVANGAPTYSVVKNSRVTVRPTDKYANGTIVLRTSSDGSGWSTFLFKKPVKLQSQTQYALFVMPHHNDPVYQCWGAKLNDIDQSSKVPIQFNQSVGPLYFWEAGDHTSTSSQAIKFLIEKAVAHYPRHYDDNYGFNEEHVIVNNLTAPFIVGETCFMSEANFSLAMAYLSSNSGAFTPGEAFYQSTGGANVSIGNIYSANSQALLLNHIVGTVANDVVLTGVSSGATANLSTVNTSVMCSNTGNTIVIPFTGNNTSSLFYANQSIYLTTADESISEVFIVSSVKTDNKTLQLSWAPSFSDTACAIGSVRGSGLALHCDWQGYDSTRFNNFVATFNNSTANTQIASGFHFSNSVGNYIFGTVSGSRCNSYGTIDLEYHNVVPQMCFDKIHENDHRIYWGGYRKSIKWTSDYPNSWRFKKR